jgi:starch-binding outer membrane protein, SusD/RagB family
MKYLKHITLGLMTVATFVVTSCSSDYLDTVPTKSVSSASMSTSLQNLLASLNGIHSKMVSQDLAIQGMGGEPGFMISRDCMGDDMTWKTNTWYQSSHLCWAANTNASSIYNAGVWKTYYQFILNANVILENLEALKSSNTFSTSEQLDYNHIKGECLCIRAWAHFQLVQYYAKRYVAGTTNTQLGVPYRLSSAMVKMARNTVEEVYTNINTDLDQAIILLSDYSADLNHYTQKVAYGLKARVTLTQQNYTVAAANAVSAITVAEKEGLAIMTQSQLTCGFADITTDTKDAMYAAMTQDDQTVYFYSFYAYMSWNFNASAIRQGVKCISSTTYNLMSSSDLRRQWWNPAGTATVPASTYSTNVYQNRKFTARSTADAVGDVAFMRLSEMYLIAAEAYARAGQEPNAKTYLDKFMAQRDPSYTTSTNTGDALAEEVMNNRRIELWGEGFRWFDLKRLNLTLKRTGTNFNISFCGFLTKTQSETGWVYEIPKAETDYNDLMVTNY